MVDIGDLGGDAPDPVDVTFGYFGQKIRAHPDLGELILVEFLAGAVNIDANSPQALTAVKDFLREVIHPDDFAAFWQAALANRQTTDQLMALSENLISKVVEVTTDRPTMPPADSSPGQSPTVESSAGDASSRAVTRLEDAGRPDLALAVQTAAAGIAARPAAKGSRRARSTG
jgi:hypothetical protein